MRHRPWGRRSLSQSRFKATMKLLGGPVHRRERNGELAKSLWEEPLFSGLYLSLGLGMGRCSAISVLTAPSESEAVACMQTFTLSHGIVREKDLGCVARASVKRDPTNFSTRAMRDPYRLFLAPCGRAAFRCVSPIRGNTAFG